MYQVHNILIFIRCALCATCSISGCIRIRDGLCHTADPPHGIIHAPAGEADLTSPPPGRGRGAGFGTIGQMVRKLVCRGDACRGATDEGMIAEGEKKSPNIPGNNFRNLTKIITAGCPHRVSCGSPQLQVQTHYSIVCAGAPVRRFPWREPSKLIPVPSMYPSAAAPYGNGAHRGTDVLVMIAGWRILGVVVSGPVIGRPDMTSEYSSMRDRVKMAGETYYWTISRPGAEPSRIMTGMRGAGSDAGDPSDEGSGNIARAALCSCSIIRRSLPLPPLSRLVPGYHAMSGSSALLPSAAAVPARAARHCYRTEHGGVQTHSPAGRNRPSGASGGQRLRS